MIEASAPLACAGRITGCRTVTHFLELAAAQGELGWRVRVGGSAQTSRRVWLTAATIAEAAKLAAGGSSMDQRRTLFTAGAYSRVRTDVVWMCEAQAFPWC
ncbi:hypothetical protein ABPG75_003970 [Micractinium tetrahymenae]